MSRSRLRPLALVPALAFAQSTDQIVIQQGPGAYARGEAAFVFGSVGTQDDGLRIAIQVVNPSGDMCNVQQTAPLGRRLVRQRAGAPLGGSLRAGRLLPDPDLLRRRHRDGLLRRLCRAGRAGAGAGGPGGQENSGPARGGHRRLAAAQGGQPARPVRGPVGPATTRPTPCWASRCRRGPPSRRPSTPARASWSRAT